MGPRDHFGQTVIGLGTEHKIDRRLATHDLAALSLSHTAGNSDGHLSARPGLGFLHPAQNAQLGIDLFGGLFADMAGVEHHQISILWTVGHAIAERAQDVGHALAVIDVHLTAVGLDVEALLHRKIGHDGVMGS